MGLNFLSKNELAAKGNSYVGYLFNKKERLLYSFHLCHILPGIATLVILGRIIEKSLQCVNITHMCRLSDVFFGNLKFQDNYPILHPWSRSAHSTLPEECVNWSAPHSCELDMISQEFARLWNRWYLQLSKIWEIPEKLRQHIVSRSCNLLSYADNVINFAKSLPDKKKE